MKGKITVPQLFAFCVITVNVNLAYRVISCWLYVIVEENGGLNRINGEVDEWETKQLYGYWLVKPFGWCKMLRKLWN